MYFQKFASIIDKFLFVYASFVVLRYDWSKRLPDTDLLKLTPDDGVCVCNQGVLTSRIQPEWAMAAAGFYRPKFSLHTPIYTVPIRQKPARRCGVLPSSLGTPVSFPPSCPLSHTS